MRALPPLATRQATHERKRERLRRREEREGAKWKGSVQHYKVGVVLTEIIESSLRSR